jgi:hypothetical protein
MAKVSVRCSDIDTIIWSYVVENARMRKVSRCEALELLIKEHMQFMAKAQEVKIH